ncbi:hypothetical protein V1478_001893 [Vespula squamosa]|uniref:Uncharacterized protein n=1 Tax=Vespula squamosa TaxID=30214 RepID=A0ABD2BYE9_VESSQ
MYTNPFNRKHSTIRQVLDRLLDPTRKPIRRSESVSSSGSSTSKSSNRSWNESNHSHRGILQWGRKQCIDTSQQGLSYPARVVLKEENDDDEDDDDDDDDDDDEIDRVECSKRGDIMEH